MPVAFRGRTTCECVARSLPLVENVMLARGLIQESITIFQLGYNAAGVTASSGTHDRGGCTDVGQFSDAHIAVWRWAGWTMQRRYPPDFDPHAHGWPWGCTHLSPAAQAQATQWSNRQNGLVSRGRVEGPWPVVDFRTGIKRMETELTQFADDIVSRTADRTAKIVLAAVAGKVWKTDDMISNVGFTSNTDNTDVTGKTAIEETFKEVADITPTIEARLDSQDKHLAELTQAISALSAKLDKGPVA